MFRVHVDPNDRTVDIEIDQPSGDTARITLVAGRNGHYNATVNDPRVDATLCIRDGRVLNTPA